MGERYLHGRYEMEGKYLSEQLMTKVISLRPDTWEYEEERISEFIFHSYGEKSDRNYTIFDSQNDIILNSDYSLSQPIKHISYPLSDSGIRVGTFKLSYSVKPLLQESLIILLFSMAAGLLIVLLSRIPIRELQKTEQQLNYLATTDPLTGQKNRRAIMDELKLELERTKRYNSIFSIIMYDIDHFKQINDTFGHDVGDEVLIELSKLFRRKVRPMDKISRLGGEEFLILVPETSAANAFEMAEHLRIIISEYQLFKIPQMTISAGIAQYQVGDTINDLLKRADIALYEAKQNGRNQVAFNS